jgi:hypothetical protein
MFRSSCCAATRSTMRDDFVSTGQPLAQLTSEVQSLLAAKRCPSAQPTLLIQTLRIARASPGVLPSQSRLSRGPGLLHSHAKARSIAVRALPDVKILLAPGRYPSIVGSEVCPVSTLYCGANRP